jgi:hypothetical protein
MADPDASLAQATLPEAPSPGWVRFEAVLRRVAVAILCGIVAAAAVGLLGVTSGVSSGTGAGLEVDVEHARVARPGLAVPFTITVRATGAGDLPSRLRVVVSRE